MNLKRLFTDFVIECNIRAKQRMFLADGKLTTHPVIYARELVDVTIIDPSNGRSLILPTRDPEDYLQWIANIYAREGYQKERLLDVLKETRRPATRLYH